MLFCCYGKAEFPNTLEIILICWSDAYETLMINIENRYAA